MQPKITIEMPKRKDYKTDVETTDRGYKKPVYRNDRLARRNSMTNVTADPGAAGQFNQGLGDDERIFDRDY